MNRWVSMPFTVIMSPAAGADLEGPITSDTNYPEFSQTHRLWAQSSTTPQRLLITAGPEAQPCNHMVVMASLHELPS